MGKGSWSFQAAIIVTIRRFSSLSQVGFKDVILHYLAKFSSVIDLLATPAEELLQVCRLGLYNVLSALMHVM